MSPYYDTITLIGVSTGSKYRCYLRGGSIDRVAELIAHAKCIVTFNGTLFDLKFLAREFPNLKFPKAHVDLRFFARRVGLSGGQKKIEDELGINRASDVKYLKGEHAPGLWYEYTRGDRKAAKLLIRYNHADVEGMKFLLDKVIFAIKEKTDVFPPILLRENFSMQRSRLSFASEKEQRGRIYVANYRGPRGPRISLNELCSLVDNLTTVRIVGIDLTGSEKRPSGWCLLVGRNAETKRVHSDEDLINDTLRAKPHIVSIDSPLSLPAGRTRVTDDDPRRDEIGIMRECERTLKKRGVNVYPSLIPSMQRLTERGIMLAQRLRESGVPVIESYPGAAQDIMGILRKRASQEHLSKGLGDFGIRGAFLRGKVTHDELDAITAAVVGQFFWAGKFEALGNEVEDYLIVPDLQTNPKLWISRSVIGVSGHIAAGKTTAAKHLESQGFTYGRYSEVLARLLARTIHKGTNFGLADVA